jgi:hypothetical protein
MGLLDSLASTLLDVYVRQPALMKEQQTLQDRQLQEQLLSQSAMQGRMPQNVNIPNFDPSVLSTLSNISNTVAQRRQQMASQIDQMVQNKVMLPQMGALIKLGLNSNHPEIFANALSSYMGYKGRTESASTMAGAEVKSAQLGKEGRVESAGIEAGARKYATDVSSRTAIGVANIGAAAKRDVANAEARVQMQKAIERAGQSLSGNFNSIVKFSQNNANSSNLPSLIEGHNQSAANAAAGLGAGLGFALENSTYNIPNVGLSYGFKNAVQDAIEKNLDGRIPPNLRKAYAAAIARLDKDPGPALDQLHKSGLLDDESFQAFLDQLKKTLEYYQNAQGIR